MDKDFSDMMNKFSDMMGNLSSNKNNYSNNNYNKSDEKSSFNIDINTFIRLKSVMEKVNSKDDPRENLLRSLKPYLREDKKYKVDQYINLFSMSKIMDVLKETGGESK